MQAVGGPVVLSDAEAEAWFERVVEPGGPSHAYRLIVDATGAMVGEVSFSRMDPSRRSAHLNIKVAYAHRRRGYGREALALFLRTFYEDLDGQEMVDDLALGNVGARPMLRAAGFEHDPLVEGVYMMRLSRARYFAS